MSLVPMRRVICPTCQKSFQVAKSDSMARDVGCPFCRQPMDTVLATNSTASNPTVCRGRHVSLAPSGLSRKRVMFRCARHGLSFSVWFVPLKASDRYGLDEIETHDQPPLLFGMFRKAQGSPAVQGGLEDIAAFDLTGWECPYCGHGGVGLDGAFFQCGCGELVCGGRSRRTLLGGRIYRCHCGVEGRASGGITSLSTSKVSQAGVRTSRASTPTFLSKPISRGLLPKK